MSNEQKHTLENIWPQSGLVSFKGQPCRLGSEVDATGQTQGEADYSRARACVNACAGYADPAAMRQDAHDSVNLRECYRVADAERKALMAQNAELRTVLEATSMLNDRLLKDCFGDEWVEQKNAALAKAQA